ncbi:hypothetical protein ACFPPD_25845 [Cohnella suwonensis]|uniref:Uncharacterized protein n=1 Tax=Cohnella suwonensis TaxID=696072 RepID=A0ABW0M1S0_9BACL
MNTLTLYEISEELKNTIQNMINKVNNMRKKNLSIIISAILIIYIVFFPSPTAEIAVRKHLLFTFHPIKAFSNSVQEGTIKNDPKYGDLYEVDGINTPLIYVKKFSLGWRVTSSGTGP